MKGISNLLMRQVTSDWKTRPLTLFAEIIAMGCSITAMLTLAIMGNDAPAELVLGLFLVGSVLFIYSSLNRALVVPLLMSITYSIIEATGFVNALLN